MEDFRTVIEQHYPLLYKIGRSYTRTSADFDDLCKEMLIHIYQSLNNFKIESSLSTWIYRVALNTALTFHRLYDLVHQQEIHQMVIRQTL